MFDAKAFAGVLRRISKVITLAGSEHLQKLWRHGIRLINRFRPVPCKLFGVKFTKVRVSAYVTIPKIHGGEKCLQGTGLRPVPCKLFGVKFTKFGVSAYVTIPKIHGGAKSNRGQKSVTIFVCRNFCLQGTGLTDKNFCRQKS